MTEKRRVTYYVQSLSKPGTTCKQGFKKAKNLRKLQEAHQKFSKRVQILRFYLKKNSEVKILAQENHKNSLEIEDKNWDAPQKLEM